MPKSNIGAGYYLRKLKLQNLMMFELGPNAVTFYGWTEDQTSVELVLGRSGAASI